MTEGLEPGLGLTGPRRADSKDSVARTALEQLSKSDLIALLLAQEARQAAEMAAMQARIAELERRLGQDAACGVAPSYGPSVPVIRTHPSCGSPPRGTCCWPHDRGGGS